MVRLGSRTHRAAAMAVLTAVGCSAAKPPTQAGRSVAGETVMTATDITPQQAHQLLASGGYVYLDVRTVPEFANGHPPAALNVPVVEMNPAIGRMEANPTFLSVVEAAIPRDAQLIVGCKTGGRSKAACEILAAAGYKNLCNMVGGFAGITDPGGQVVTEGWSTSGYPIERGPGGDKSYDALQRKPAP